MMSLSNFHAPTSLPAGLRFTVAGKFLRCGGEKIFMEGVSYGPFRPNAGGEPFPEAAQLAADFAQIRALGFNTVRVYELPGEVVLGAARVAGLRLMVGIPWTQHVDFLCERTLRREIEGQVRDAAARLGQHEAVAALLVGNEIEKTLVRWMGPERVKGYIERLIAIARAAAPHCLVSYATYPSTEYLLPDNADFLAVNIYLEDRAAFTAYVRRLHHLAGPRPLVITEFGIDVQHHGEGQQAAMLGWYREACAQLGVAGSVWFAFTDEWYRGGAAVTDWSFGLVDAARRERQACLAIRQQVGLMGAAPRARMMGLAARGEAGGDDAGRGLRISVIVCTHNGSATLRGCLAALSGQTYANHEIMVIDDGSSDAVAEIARDFPQVRYHRQEHRGLSVARNAGAALATGEVVAYTDDDCLPDEDWLHYLALALADPLWVAAGGPNLAPAPRNSVERCVAAAPGGPAHVLLNDEEAEHLPGCNLAIRKAALEAIGGFNAVFTTAGDDVDVCWRLREAGGRLRFVSAAMVWHHRRFTVAAYFRQQRGYGYAEALLTSLHPQHFGPLGGARWRGAIYGDSAMTLPPREGSIYHGPLGYGAFQVIYASGYGLGWWHWFAGLLWLAFALLALAFRLPWVSAGIVVLAAAFAAQRAVGLAGVASHHAGLGIRTFGHAVLFFWLCLWQPVVREWARVRGLWMLGARPSFQPSLPDIVPPSKPRKGSLRLRTYAFWSEQGLGRDEWLAAMRVLLDGQGVAYREDDGWRWFDIECRPDGIVSPAFVSVTEYHQGQQRLTRVGLVIRLRVAALALRWGFFWLLSMAAFPVAHRLGDVALRGALILTLSVVLEMVWLSWRYGRRVTAAARQAGLRLLPRQ